MQGYWWIVYVGAVVILTVAYHFLAKQRETVIFLAGTLAAMAAIGQLQAGAAQLQAGADQSAEDVKHRRLEVSFRYMDKWNSSPIRDILPTASTALQALSGHSPQEMQAFLEGHEDDRHSLTTLFNFFEDAGLAIRTGYADNGALCQYLSEPSLRYFSTLRPWLDYFRNQTGRRGAYEHYEWLYDSWSKGCPSRSLEK